MYPPYGGTGLYGIYGNLGLWGSLLAYGSLNLTDGSPSQVFTEPISLAEAYSFLKIPLGSDDADVLALIIAARMQAEIMQGRDLVVKQWDLTYDFWPSFRVGLRSPLLSVDLVRYRDSNGDYNTLTENVDYIVDKSRKPGSIMPMYNQVWPTYVPWPSSSLLIRHTSGYSSSSPWWANTGALVKVGMRKLISLYYFQRTPFTVSIQQDPVLLQCLSTGALERVR